MSNSHEIAAPSSDEPKRSFVDGRAFPLLMLAASVAVIVVVNMVQPITYATGDDYLQDLVSHGGYGSLGPSLIMSYSLLPISALLYAGYTLLPAVPWFPLTLCALLTLGTFVMSVMAARLYLPRGARASVVVGVFLLEVLFTTYLTYTMVAAYASAAGAVAMFGRLAPTGRGKPVRWQILGLVLAFLGVSLRLESGLLAMLVFAPFVLWVLLSRRDATHVVLFVATLALVGAASWGTTYLKSNTDGWQEYTENVETLQKIIDRPQPEDTQAMQEASGLSENDIDLLYDFVFADSSVYDLSTYEAILPYASSASLSVLVSTVLVRPLLAVYVAGLFLILLLQAIALARMSGARGRARLAYLLTMLCVLLAFAYVYAVGRVKIRVTLSTFFAGFAALYGLFSVAGAESARQPAAGRHAASRAVGRPRIATVTVSVLGLFATLCLLAFIQVSYLLPTRDGSIEEMQDKAQELIDSNPQNTYIVVRDQAILVGGNIWDFSSWNMPDNAIMIGSYERYMPAWEAMTTSAGLSETDFPEWALDDESQQVVCTEEVAEELRTYLEEHSGSPVEKTQVTSLGSSAWTTDEVSVWVFSSAA